MKKMTTVFAIIALTFTLSTIASGKPMKRNRPGGFGIQGGITKGRQSTATPTGTVTFGKVKAPQAKLRGSSAKEFDRGYLPPNALRGYRGTTTVNQGNNLTINWGDGNNTLRSARVQHQNKVGRPNHIAGFGEDLLRVRGGRGHGQPTQLTDFGPTNARRKIVGSPEYFNVHSQPNHLSGTGVAGAGAYRRGSFAKARGKQGH